MLRNLAMSVMVLFAFCLTPAPMPSQVVGGSIGAGHPENPGADANRYELNGTVVNAITGEKIARALVVVNGEDGTLSDAEGQFHFAGLSQSYVTVTVRKPGYWDEEHFGHYAGLRNSRIEISAKTQPLTLKLVPAALITGQITGVENEPVENALVRVLGRQIVNGHGHWQQEGTAQSDEDGRYRIANLRAGQYIVSVSASNENDLVSLTEAHAYPLQWFYPGVPERNAATPVKLDAAQEFHADFVLAKQPAFKIDGTVMKPADAPAFSIQLASADGEFLPKQIRRMGAGGFEIDQVPAGDYILRADTQDTQWHQYHAEVPISVRSNMSGITLSTNAATKIPVVAKTELTQPHPEMQQNVFPVQVVLEGTEGNRSGFAPPTAADNRELAILTPGPGRYRAVLSPNYGFYVQSATCGDVDLLREPLVVGSGGAMPPIEVTLRDDAGSLEVKFNPPPESGAQVLVVADDRPAQSPQVAYVPAPPSRQTGIRSINQGSMTGIPNLAPGNYTVYAFDRIDELEYANPEVMQKYQTRATHVTIHPSAKTNATVELITVGE
jgi:hypothetical protein